MPRILLIIVFILLCFVQSCKDSSQNDAVEEIPDLDFDPVPATNLSITLQDSTLTLLWTDASEGEDGFKIESSFDDSTWTEVGQSEANVRTFSSADIELRDTTWFRVVTFKNISEDRDSVVTSAKRQVFFGTPEIVIDASVPPYIFGYKFGLFSPAKQLFSYGELVIYDKDQQDTLFVGQFNARNQIELPADSVRIDLGGIQEITYTAFLTTGKSNLIGTTRTIQLPHNPTFEINAVQLQRIDSVRVSSTLHLTRADMHYEFRFMDGTELIETFNPPPFLNFNHFFSKRVSVEDQKEYELVLLGKDMRDEEFTELDRIRYSGVVDNTNYSLLFWFAESWSDSVKFSINTTNTRFPIRIYRRTVGVSDFEILKEIETGNNYSGDIIDALPMEDVTYEYRAKMVYATEFTGTTTVEIGPDLEQVSGLGEWYGSFEFYHKDSRQFLTSSGQELTVYSMDFDKVNSLSLDNADALGINELFFAAYSESFGLTLGTSFPDLSEGQTERNLPSVFSNATVDDIFPTEDQDRILVAFGGSNQSAGQNIEGTELVAGVYSYAVSTQDLELILQDGQLAQHNYESNVVVMYNRFDGNAVVLNGQLEPLATFRESDLQTEFRVMSARYQAEYDILIVSTARKTYFFNGLATANQGELSPFYVGPNGFSGVATNNEEVIVSDLQTLKLLHVITGKEDVLDNGIVPFYGRQPFFFDAVNKHLFFQATAGYIHKSKLIDKWKVR